MKDQSFRKLLNQFLGISRADNVSPQEQKYLEHWSGMRDSKSLPMQLKQKGWEEILRKRAMQSLTDSI